MSVELANFTTTTPGTYAEKLDLSIRNTLGSLCKNQSKLKANHLPPQQKPAEAMAETPLLFRAAITSLASSQPLS